MPELPEVETVKNGLQELCGTTLKVVITRFPRLRYPLDTTKLNQEAGSKILKVSRRAKYVIIHLERGYLLIHLGMSGRITLLKQNVPLQKHDHVDIVCDNLILRYNDPRRFGCVVYITELENSSILGKLGPEPLEQNFTPDYLYQKIKTRKTPIKQLIMDNAIVVGVGNIYACESLFLSKISPLRNGLDINLKECQILVQNIQKVLHEAIAAGGSSLRDYKNAHGELGYFQQSHNVYGKAKKTCRICSSIIREIRLGQRNSFYCPQCQS
ncbi:MAG: bifunctional DNA-formamidopyrimidine glycosylase/DNA-(apurinic or apyrimidinic site) lyase [Burkholderiales bacterium]|nr:bifunctional DNA-formamidopyrimidine glycosylase/DNA-(apurinic or apyrimidinic site) lyase [Burkholderiales bacterium]